MNDPVHENDRSFQDVKVRLDEIVDLVSDEDLPLNDALALYEEAIKLGLSACDLSEVLPEEQTEEDVASEGEVAEGQQDTPPVEVQEDRQEDQQSDLSSDTDRDPF